jgi:hypothetical protein
LTGDLPCVNVFSQGKNNQYFWVILPLGQVEKGFFIEPVGHLYLGNRCRGALVFLALNENFLTNEHKDLTA